MHQLQKCSQLLESTLYWLSPTLERARLTISAAEYSRDSWQTQTGLPLAKLSRSVISMGPALNELLNPE
jgi:hypothetical protein